MLILQAAIKGWKIKTHYYHSEITVKARKIRAKRKRNKAKIKVNRKVGAANPTILQNLNQIKVIVYKALRNRRILQTKIKCTQTNLIFILKEQENNRDTICKNRLTLFLRKQVEVWSKQNHVKIFWKIF